MKSAFQKYFQYVHMIIVILLMFAFRFLPTFSTVTAEGMQVLGIFLGLVYGWLFVGMLWPGIAALVALMFTDVITLDQIYVQGFGNSVFLMVLFMWAFCNILTQAKISDKLAMKLLSLKIVDGKPWVFFSVAMLAAWVVSMLMGGIIPLLIMFPIIGNICIQFGYPAFSKTSTFMLFGILVASCLGQMCMPIMGTPLALLGIYMSMDSSFVLNLGQYALFAVPYTIAILIVFILCAKFIFRVDLSGFVTISSSMFDKESLKFTKKQRLIMLSFILILFAVLLTSVVNVFPASGLKTMLTKLGTIGPVLIGFLVLMLVKVDGEPLFDFRAAIADVSWDVLITIAASLPVIALLTNDITGIKPMIMQTFMPLLGQMSPLVFSVLVIILTVVLTNFISNYAAAIIFYTITLMLGPTLGVETLPVIYSIMVCSHLAYATPAASVFAQISFANTEWIDSKQFMKYTVLMLIPLSIFAAFAGIFIGNLIV